MQENDNWLKINDSELSPIELQTEVKRRLQQRRQALGEIHQQFSDFGVLSAEPEITLNNAALAYHIHMANTMEPPPANLVLAPSPATRTPLLGKLWQSVRKQFHELVLFYVNRVVSHETRLDNHIISSLNELIRIVQEQQSEIERLHEQIRALEEERQ
jgi:hypothetical protein